MFTALWSAMATVAKMQRLMCAIPTRRELAYYRSISGQERGDPHAYELCVDASDGREVCAETIIRFVQCKAVSN